MSRKCEWPYFYIVIVWLKSWYFEIKSQPPILSWAMRCDGVRSQCVEMLTSQSLKIPLNSRSRDTNLTFKAIRKFLWLHIILCIWQLTSHLTHNRLLSNLSGDIITLFLHSEKIRNKNKWLEDQAFEQDPGAWPLYCVFVEMISKLSTNKEVENKKKMWICFKEIVFLPNYPICRDL